MHKITVRPGCVYVVGGGDIVGLDAGQSAARLHKLDAMGEGVWRAREPLQFRGGETISVATIGKGQMDLVDEIDAASRKKR